VARRKRQKSFHHDLPPVDVAQPRRAAFSVSPLRGENNVLALAYVPGNDEAFDPVDDPRTGRRRAAPKSPSAATSSADRRLPMSVAHIADARIGADELTDHRADYGQCIDPFRPEKIAGIACGRLTAPKHPENRLPCIARAKVDHVGVEPTGKPLHRGTTTTGKNPSRNAEITFGMMPNPNHTTNSGAIAIFGTDCENTKSGRR